MEFQLELEKTPYFVWVWSSVIILFKMENFKGGLVYQPNILYDIKSPPKNRAEENYEYCEDQVDYDTKESHAC